MPSEKRLDVKYCIRITIWDNDYDKMSDLAEYVADHFSNSVASWM